MPVLASHAMHSSNLHIPVPFILFHHSPPIFLPISHFAVAELIWGKFPRMAVTVPWRAKLYDQAPPAPPLNDPFESLGIIF